VYRKDDPSKKIFTPTDMLALTNPMVIGPGLSGTKGAMIKHQDGNLEPNHFAPVPGEKDSSEFESDYQNEP
jgi:hypothetical protein